MILGARNIFASAREHPAFHSRPHGEMTSLLTMWLMHGTNPPRPYYEFTDRWKDEEEFQITLLDTLYATTTIDFEAVHIPNGGLRSKATAARLKRAGARAGVADLFCGWACGGSGWLELKAKSGTPSPSQRQFGKWVIEQGGRWAVTRTVADAFGTLISWGAPIKREFHGIARLRGSSN